MSKRRYADVAVVPHDGAFSIALDGHTVKTPGGVVLMVRTMTLGDAVAEEWRAQGETILPTTMPLTRYASTAIDRIAPARGRIIDAMMRHVDTDALCYRAEDPANLVARQSAQWDPILDWAQDRFAVRFTVTQGIMPVHQPEDHHRALRGYVSRFSDLSLTVLGDLAEMTGSLIIAAAAAEGRLDAEQAFALSHLDETYQIERWGQDEEARIRRDNVKTDIGHAVNALVLDRD